MDQRNGQIEEEIRRQQYRDEIRETFIHSIEYPVVILDVLEFFRLVCLIYS